MLKNKPMQARRDPQPMQWFDSHCHLDSVDEPAAEVLAAAASAGVTSVVTVGTDLESSSVCCRLAREFGQVWAAVGIHPHEARHADEEVYEALISLARQEKVVAIGEIGLDFYRDHSPRDSQIDAFIRQLQIAEELDKPVVLHIRDAHADAFRILEEAGPLPGTIFHCFSAGPEEVRTALNLGGYISFAGNVSFKNAPLIREACALVPPDRLLLETDSPYLAPVPHRGKPNRPGFLPQVGAAVAHARGDPEQAVARRSVDNARKVFRIS